MKYALKSEEKEAENMAKAYGRDLGISTKHSTEICRNITGKSVARAKTILSEVVLKKTAIRMRRYTMDRAHQKGVGPGRFPVKAAEAILKIVESAESNAQNKGLNTKDLVIVHISAHKAARPWHMGRQRRRKTKRSHIQVVVKEVKEKQKKTKSPEETKK
jgi:large subunit ribosomal protein L22